MIDFWVYDVIFMVAFCGFITWFLLKRKKDLSREGIMFMWRTKFGMNAIKKVGTKHKKLFHKIKPVVITIGYLLTIGVFWMLVKSLMTYILNPNITDVIKAPPIAPLIPYFPKLFGMESYFPPFYFTYFLLALAVIAIVHEFSHGVFMQAFKVKIKSTGMIFIGPILGAFVEQDEKSMRSKKNSEQMTILAAGVFANLITAIVFYLIYILFFFAAFTPSGYSFDYYTYTAIPTENITGFTQLENDLTLVSTTSGSYYLDEELSEQINEDYDYIYAYIEAPALLSGLKGYIIKADGQEIVGQDGLQAFLQSKEPGDTVFFTTENDDGKIDEYEVTLASSPQDSSKAYLGVVNIISSSSGIFSRTITAVMNFKDDTTYYKPSLDGNFIYFIQYLIWWVMVINLLVALFNMLPIGILDGGRFFYLGNESLFKSKKVAEKISKIILMLIISIVVLMMAYWLFGILS
jgi:hypothetical protein